MDQLLDEHALLHDVEAALERREFEVYFQPKCNMLTEKVVGAEALARWRHPTRGLIPPSSFIPLFERNGFIKQLDLYIWEETARRLRRWIDMGHRPLPVSVNISRTDILTMDVCAALEEILRRYRLEPSLLELEITESTYVNQPEAVIRTVERLMRRKFTILMDDFGSGYSSLNMLNNVNVDILKLDMRFLEHNGQKSKDILESVVHMSKWLDLPLIAEGVEYQWQVDFLKELGCVYAQGFFFYRPMPAEDYEALLLDGRVPDSLGGMLCGIGSGLLAMAGSTLLNLRHEAKHPEMARQHDIEQKDERNVAIRNRAKAVSGEVLQWSVLAAAWLSIGLDAPLWVPLAATGVFVAKSVLELYLMIRYEREM